MTPYLKNFFSRNAASDEFQPSASSVSWILSVVASVYRKPIPKWTGSENTPMQAVQAHLLEAGFQCSKSALSEWLDDSQTARDAKIIIMGTRPGVIFWRNESEALILDEGSTTPTPLPLDAVVGRLEGHDLYKVSRQEESSPETFGWKWFSTAMLARKAVIRDLIVSSLVLQLIALAYPMATQVIVDKVISNQATSTLIAVGVGITLFAFFNALMTWLRQKLLLRLANVVDAELAGKVMLHLFRLPIGYFEKRSTGVLIARIKGVERVREFASSSFLLLALEVPFIFIFLGFMLWYSPLLTAIVLGVVLVMVGFSFACGPHLRNLANRQFEAGAKVQGFLTERVAAYETIKSVQLENQSVARFNELNRLELDTALTMREFASGYSTFMQLAEQLLAAAVLCTGAYLAMTTGEFTIGMLVAFQMFSQRVSQPLLKLAGTWQELQQVRTAVTQLGEVMGASTERYSLIPTSAGKSTGGLEVQELCFRHAPNRPPVYSNLSFSIKPGQTVLITGPSGSGKSTLAKIMLGLYASYEGFVRVDGRDIRSMPVNELRGLFGVVPQETVLFSGSIAENVMAGANASFEQAVAACRMAGIHSAIENMEAGYQTHVGERGAGLSGGQRQRIGIARALLRQPVVLIFDEATSGLDSESAEHIARSVNRLRGRVTVLFVAHTIPSSLIVDNHVSLQSGTGSA